ncbi:AbrB family transcriptional regulator [Pseudooceanicola algae]|uniref:Uncharacterized protein n=1 Tax=Pseudooceanicola algae TaxID=1537215 RepID=A0A418SIW1_9RHOB|nr:AbrB family transcriptional regulator [Pseudooceanicola algae]QPM91174.1 hypothetical protein PSAL_024230 [Pseudooceanicola algae]
MTGVPRLDLGRTEGVRGALQWAAMLSLASALALVLTLVHFPAAPLLGAMIAGIGFGASGSPLRIPRPIYVLAQGCAGVFIATAMSPAILVDMIQDWPLLLLMTALTLTAAFAIGWAVNRRTGIDRDVAIYGSLPGMSGAMVIIATERGADARVVALMQYVRLAGVIVSIAVLASLLPSQPGEVAVLREVTPLSSVVALGIAAMSLLTGRLRFLPGAGMLVPMILGAVIEAGGFMHLSMPAPVLVLTFGIIGLEVGLKFTRDVLGKVMRLMPVVLVSTMVLILISALLGWALSMLTDLDLKTALLATAPGSIETVALVAISTNANVAAVLAFQTVRMFAVVLFGPMIVGRLARLPIWSPARPPLPSRR